MIFPKVGSIVIGLQAFTSEYSGFSGSFRVMFYPRFKSFEKWLTSKHRWTTYCITFLSRAGASLKTIAGNPS
jgi:hypothetical protein